MKARLSTWKNGDWWKIQLEDGRTFERIARHNGAQPGDCPGLHAGNDDYGPVFVALKRRGEKRVWNANPALSMNPPVPAPGGSDFRAEYLPVEVGDDLLALIEKNCARPHECSCGVVLPKKWEVASTGPHSYGWSFVFACDACWHDSVRGDGHCYSGHFSEWRDAKDHAASMSR